MTIIQYLCSVPPSPGALHSLSLCIHMLKAGRLMTFIQSICAVTVFCPQQDHKSSSSPYIKTSPYRKKQRAINHILTIQTDPNYPNPPISTMATETHGVHKDEDSDTVYTLTVYTPKRKKPFMPACVHRTHYPKNEGGYMISPEDPYRGVKQYTDFKRKDLVDMKTKEVEVSGRDLMFKCRHIRESGVRECKGGCYVLEKGGNKKEFWGCQRGDCEGHSYNGPAAWASNGFLCFGKKGKRMVCIDPSLELS